MNGYYVGTFSTRVIFNIVQTCEVSEWFWGAESKKYFEIQETWEEIGIKVDAEMVFFGDLGHFQRFCPH